MDCKYFRLSKFDKAHPKVTQGTPWVKLYTRSIDHTEDFRGCSDTAKLTFYALLAAAPKSKNIFPNDPEYLAGMLGIESIELDELLEGEFLEVVDEQQYFDGQDPPDVTERKANDALVDLLRCAWNDMANTCALQVRTRVVYQGKVYKTILIRFKDGTWVNLYQQALDSIPGLDMLTKPGASTGRQWRANFDWFIQTNSVNMILDGKYGTPQGREGMHYDDKIGF